MRRIQVALVVVVAATLAFVSPASAQDDTFTIAVEGIITGQAEGAIVEVANQAVAPALVGSTCTVTGASQNNGSVHPGNNLIIATGGSSTNVPGVEEVPGQVVAGTGSVTLGTDVVVSVEFGSSGATSGGVTLTFDCAQAPAGGVATGAGGTAGDGGQFGIIMLAVGAAALLGSGALLGWNRFSRIDV